MIGALIGATVVIVLAIIGGSWRLSSEISALKVEVATLKGDTREWTREFVDRKILEHAQQCPGCEVSNVFKRDEVLR